VTLSAAWSEVDLRALRGVLGDPAHLTASATLQHVCRLVPAARAGLIERDHTGRTARLICTAVTPSDSARDLLLDTMRQVLDRRQPPRALAVGLTAAHDETSDAWLVLMRDGGAFAEADRITLELLRPHLVSAHQRAARSRRATCGLTARERQVLALVARGYRNDEIAQRLVLSPGTVRKHLDNAYRELGVSNRAAAVARAFPDGLSAYA
jgi:DNA-binding NarL/FixJ family response regulator